MIPAKQRQQKAHAPFGVAFATDVARFGHRRLPETRPLAPAGGFTLIELLVVIAVIGILAAILLPALARSKAQAQSTVCKNHLHEMGIALEMYVDDCKVYPYGMYSIPHPPYTTLLRWHDVLQPYYRLSWTNQAYHCPAYNGFVCSPAEDLGFNSSYGSYSYNVFGTTSAEGIAPPGNEFLGLGVAYGEFLSLPPRSQTQIVAPSEMYALMDTRATTPYPVANSVDSGGYYIGTGSSGLDWTSCVGLFFGEFGLGTGNMTLYQPPSWPLPHGKASNVVCCDGHVAAVPVVVLFNPEISARNWNADHQPHPDWWLGNPISAAP